MTVIKYWQRQLKGRKHFIIAHSSRGIQFPTLGKTRHQVGKKWLQAQETDQSHCIQFQKLVWAGSWGGLESLKSCPRWPASIREASPPGGPMTSKRPQLQNCSNLGAWEGGRVAFSYSHPIKLSSCPVSSLAFLLFTQAEVVFIHTFVLSLYVYCFFSSPTLLQCSHSLLLWTYRPCSNAKLTFYLPHPPKRVGV